MQPDGSYIRRAPTKGRKAKSSQQTLIDWVEKRRKEATRLKRRKPRGIKMRNVR